MTIPPSVHEQMAINEQMDRDEQLRQEFNEWAKAGRGEGMEEGHGPVGRQAIDQMNIPADGRVLDVGCGSGWGSRLIAGRARNGRVGGMHSSEEVVAHVTDTS